MGYDNFKTFFDMTIRPYRPYTDNSLYSTFFSFLLDPVFKESYDTIPTKFISLFENQTIPSEIYDILLTSLGYPNSFVSSISIFHKKIILNKLSNFNKYKTTLNHFEEICKIFSEPVNLYELYITKKKDDYFFTPKSIYISNSEYLTNDIKYDDVYANVPSYFISKDVINNYYKNESIIFPIKSNLLYFTLSEIIDFSDIKNLITSVVLYHFKDINIPIVFNNGSYIISLNSISQLWFYLLNLYSSNFQLQPISIPITYYDIENSKNKYVLDSIMPGVDIQIVIDAYNKIKTISEVYIFINTYIKPVYSAYPTIQITTLESLRNSLSYQIDIKIIEQIEFILINSANVNQEIFSLLSDVLQSIKTWILNSSDTLLKKYGKYIIEIFHLPFSSIDNSVIYKLVHFFKPYHTEIYIDNFSSIIYKSNTDTIIPTILYRTTSTNIYYSALTIGDDFILKIDGVII
jgi:hypothetical protein